MQFIMTLLPQLMNDKAIKYLSASTMAKNATMSLPFFTPYLISITNDTCIFIILTPIANARDK